MGVNLTKEETIKKINLQKEEVHKIRLTKSSLINQKMYAAVVLDFSGSMSSLYSDGTVQEVLESALPIALEYDNDGAAEVWIFDTTFHRLSDINLTNVYGYVKNNIIGKYSMGGTSYSQVMKDVIKQYKKKTTNGLFRKAEAKLPEYVLFITDGDNGDKLLATQAIIEASHLPIFWQFVGVGHDNFSFLKKLDELQGRFVDNTNFFSVNNVTDITYDMLFKEYPEWLENPKVKQMIK